MVPNMVENGMVAAEDMGVAENEKRVGKKEENAIVEVYFHFALFYYFLFFDTQNLSVFTYMRVTITAWR